MAAPKIVIAEFMEQSAVDRLAETHETLYRADLVTSPDYLVEALASAEALIVRNRTQVTAALLDAAPNLKIVGRLGVGLDNIDLEACKARNIRVKPASGANADAVAEYVIGAILRLARAPAFGATDRVLAGEWPRAECQGREVSGKFLGLVGYGDIARRVAARARAMGMDALAFDPLIEAASGARLVSFEDLLARSDAISLHVPLTDATRGLFDAEAIGAMKKTAILVNTSRGGVVDETALGAALRAGDIAGAALDVFATEPLTEEAAAPLRGAPNLIATPHIAGVTDESNIRVSSMIADAILAALK